MIAGSRRGAVPLRLTLDGAGHQLIERGLARIRREFEVPNEFPVEVLRDAQRAVAERTGKTAELDDQRDVPLRTLDPAGSRDLDQAFAIARRAVGYRLWYAVADVAGFVRPNGPLDHESRARGVTLYLPDRRAGLHPELLSEGAASLLSGQETPALLWSFDLDRDGVVSATRVRRALVRSRAQLSYPQVQDAVDRGMADEQVALLVEVGRVLREREIARGGVSLDLPEQQVKFTATADDAGYRLAFRRPLEAEHHNAQLSLLTGIAAAQVMLDGGIGLLRTLPQAGEEALDTLRRAGRELGYAWPADQPYADWIRTVAATEPKGVALVTQALHTFRGAGYEAFDGTAPVAPQHAALAAPYAHVTAPLRRLADRFANQVVLDLVAERPPAEWAVEALPELPAIMARAGQRAAAIDRAVVDLVESVVLSPTVGTTYAAIAVNRRGDDTIVHLLEPAVVATLAGHGNIPLGSTLEVRLVEADPQAGTVRFALA